MLSQVCGWAKSGCPTASLVAYLLRMVAYLVRIVLDVDWVTALSRILSRVLWSYEIANEEIW